MKMHNGILTRFLFSSIICLIVSGTALRAQEDPTELGPVEVKLAAGFMSKLNFNTFAFGVVGSVQPRFFVSPTLAISARAQWAGYIAVPIDGDEFEGEINTYSFLGGIHSRNRQKKASFLWGIETGVAYTREYIGTDANGYSEFGPSRAFWALQPSIGFNASRFELEALYHYSPSNYARYFTLTAGIRLGGGVKK